MADDLDWMRTTRELRQEVESRTGTMDGQLSALRESQRGIERRVASDADRSEKIMDSLHTELTALRHRISALEAVASGVNDKVMNAIREPLDRIETRLEEQIDAKASKAEVKTIRDDIRRGVWIVMSTVIAGAVTAGMLAATGRLPGLG